MFYFKTVPINNASPQHVEEAIREYTKIRNSYLDFIITANDIHGNKFFSGLERKDELLITRMQELRHVSILGDSRPIQSRYTPTVFVRFKKGTGFSSYQIRLGFIFVILALVILLWLLFGVWRLFHGHFELSSLFFGSIFLFSFLIGTKKEINNTKKLINKAIELHLHHE